jgi:predicted PurR-regulated permease PerM
VTIDTPDDAVASAAQAVGKPGGLHARGGQFALQGLFVLALLAALTVGRSIFLPLATAFLLSLVLRPLVRGLRNWYVPPPLSALILVVLLGVALSFSVYSLKEPAGDWLKEAPHSLRQLKRRIDSLRQPITDVKAAAKALDDLKNGSRTAPNRVVVKDGELDKLLLAEMSETLVSVSTTLVVLFFILGWGDRLFRNIVRALPSFRDRREAVELVRDIEKSIATYLATITVINLLLGTVVAGTMHLLEMPNPVLWGVLAAVLNFVPYLGPAITAVILGLAAAMTYPSIGEALLVPAVFMMITAFEGNVVTPYVVGNKLTLNPLLIFLSLVVWFWMWGIIGALLTVPILVCIKAIIERTEGDTKQLARILD